jgi:hypothetical protein
MTPDDVRGEILSLIAEQAKGPDAHYEAEIAAERAEDLYQSELDKAFLTAEGNVEERKAVARLATVSLRDKAIIARAVHGRVKLKIRALDSSIMANQGVLKSMMRDGA